MSPSPEQINTADVDLQPKHALKKQRLNNMLATVNATMQNRLNEASDLLKKINESKTQAKKKYYEQKFKKIRQGLFETVAAAQYLEKIKQPEPQVAAGETTDPNYTFVEPTITINANETAASDTTHP